MRLYCIRHGETTFNAEGRIQGQLDTPLSPLGVRQSAAIARAFSTGGTAEQVPAAEHGSSIDDGPKIEVVFSSPLRRAYDTARPLAEALGVELRSDDRLRELNAGVFQGLLPEEMLERYPAETARWRSHDPDFRIPGGESRRELAARGAAVLEELLESAGRAAAVVAHGGLLTAAFKQLLGIPIERSPFMLYNGSINVLEFDGRLRLLALNRVDHLRDGDGPLGTRTGDL